MTDRKKWHEAPRVTYISDNNVTGSDISEDGFVASNEFVGSRVDRGHYDEQGEGEQAHQSHTKRFGSHGGSEVCVELI